MQSSYGQVCVSLPVVVVVVVVVAGAGDGDGDGEAEAEAEEVEERSSEETSEDLGLCLAEVMVRKESHSKM